MVLIAPPTTYAMSGPTPKASAMINSKADAVKLNTLNKTAGGKRRRRRGGASTLIVPILPTSYKSTGPVDNTKVTTGIYATGANATAQSALDKAAAPATMGGSRKGRKLRKSRKSRKSRKTRKTRRHRK